MVMFVVGGCGLGVGRRVLGDLLVDAFGGFLFGWVVRHLLGAGERCRDDISQVVDGFLLGR